MNLLAFAEFQDQAAAAGVLFYHSGEFNQSIISAAADSLKHRLDESGAAGSVKRKLFSTFVEMAQNIVHYAATGEEPTAATTAAAAPTVKEGAIGIGYEASANTYWIVCVNRIETSHVPRLTEKLEAVRAMSLDEIKQAYREQLKNDQHSEADPVSKGAGLGWLTIARDSRQPIEYSFSSDPLNGGRTAFFYVKAVI